MVIGATFLVLTLIWLTNTSIDIAKLNIPPMNKSKATKNPVIVWLTYTTLVRTERTIECFKRKCDVVPACVRVTLGDAYLFYGPFFPYISILPLPKDEESIWGLMHEECPQAAVPLMFENVLNLFNFSLSYSRHSDVPIPLMWMGAIDKIISLQYYANTSLKDAFVASNASIVFVQANCNTATERELYVAKLMEYIPVDCLGQCMKNKNWSVADHFGDFLWSKDNLQTIANYKFVITIENSVCDDYVSEKLWRALVLGVVPIYFGSPLIRDWLPNNRSAILVEDFPTPQLLSAHLYELLQNDTKYEEYLEHKTKGLITNKRLLQEVKDKPYQTDLVQAVDKFQCLVCERLHDRNSSEVSIVTKKHLDCQMPFSLLTKSVSSYNWFIKEVERVSELVKHIGAYTF